MAESVGEAIVLLHILPTVTHVSAEVHNEQTLLTLIRCDFLLQL